MNHLVDLLVEASARFQKSPALTMKMGYRTVSLTYGQLYEKSIQMAFSLQSRGIGSGDHVIICAPNSPAWVIAFWGCMIQGAVLVPLAPQNSQKLIDKIIEQTGPKLFIGSRVSRKTAGNIPQIAAENIFDLIADVPLKKDGMSSHNLSEQSLALIMYTSGTTGDPKGVMLTHGNICSNVLALQPIVPLNGPKERLLSVLPLSHMLELTIGLLLPLSKGAHIVYAHHHGAVGALLKRYLITKMIAVPELLRVVMLKLSSKFSSMHLFWLLKGMLKISGIFPLALRRAVAFPLRALIAPQLDAVASGGAPLDTELEGFWNNLGIEVMQGYGLTETSPVVSTNTFGIHKAATVGKPLENVEVAFGSDHEILIKGPNVFVGYYKNPEATQNAMTPEGYFKTGDIGSIDADGFLSINGRKKYMLKGPGAQNIFPEDIEHELIKIQGVRDACVIGLERDSGHVEIHAVLLLEKKVSPDAVVKEANSHLEAYQQISGFSVWPEEDFPRTVTKKVKRDPVKQAIVAGKEDTPTGIGRGSLLHQLIADIAGVPVEQVTDQSTLMKDLTFDSLMKVELITHIEQRYNTLIDEGTITQQTTVAQLEQIIKTSKNIKPPRVSSWQRGRLVRFLGDCLLAFLCFPARWYFKIRIHGAEHFSQLSGPALIMPNHVSLLDGLLVAAALPRAVRRKISFAAGYDVLEKQYWFASWFMKFVFNAFAFPRKETDQISIGLENVGTMLDEGFHVVVFPEGQLSPDGTLQTLKQGAGLLATTMGVPIVPMILKGVTDGVVYDTLVPKKRVPVTVRIGRCVRYMSYKDMHDVTHQIQQQLEALERGEQ